MHPHMEVSEHSPALGIRQIVVENPSAHVSRMPQVDRITAMERRILALEDQVVTQGLLIEEMRRPWSVKVKQSMLVMWRRIWH